MENLAVSRGVLSALQLYCKAYPRRSTAQGIRVHLPIVLGSPNTCSSQYATPRSPLCGSFARRVDIVEVVVFAEGVETSVWKLWKHVDSVVQGRLLHTSHNTRPARRHVNAEHTFPAPSATLPHQPAHACVIASPSGAAPLSRSCRTGRGRARESR